MYCSYYKSVRTTVPQVLINYQQEMFIIEGAYRRGMFIIELCLSMRDVYYRVVLIDEGCLLWSGAYR